MVDKDLKKALQVLHRCGQQGLSITYDKEELMLRFSKDKPVDQDFISELKANRDLLKEYFRTFKSDVNDIEQHDATFNTVRHGDRLFHRLTPVEVYWINDLEDTEYKKIDPNFGVWLCAWEVKGEFDPRLFRRAIASLITRHESLRATFHKMNGEFFMAVENEPSPLYDLEYIDQSGKKNSQQAIDDLALFRDKRINFEMGPIFMSRLIQTAACACVISLKIHHIIMDTWSLDILLRDILVGYRNALENKDHLVPPLRFQLKDHLARVNHRIRTNYNRDRSYWNSLYDRLPDDLIIPGARRNNLDLSKRIRKTERFEIDREIRGFFSRLARKFNTSTFVILQAVFKAFLASKTDQYDIAIGSFIFGRDHQDASEQIGCYASTVLIRTRFSGDDSFAEIVRKVKKSNEDMQTYNSYTLIDASKAHLQKPEDLFGSFWKVNILYSDDGPYYIKESKTLQDLSKRLAVEVTPRKPEDHDTLMTIDLVLDYSPAADGIALTVSYDSSTYDAHAIRTLMADQVSFIKKLTKEYSLDRINDISMAGSWT